MSDQTTRTWWETVTAETATTVVTEESLRDAAEKMQAHWDERQRSIGDRLRAFEKGIPAHMRDTDIVSVMRYYIWNDVPVYPNEHKRLRDQYEREELERRP